MEEAIELVQACEMPKEDVLTLVNYVYDQPVGDIDQEVGGVLVTLIALCTAQFVNLEIVANQTWKEINAKMEAIHQSNKTKPRAGVSNV